jgi:glycosyltransferase involved in cell wall biosynthesis
MKVLILNTSDHDGGAARAAYRLHDAISQSGIKSQMLVQKKTTLDSNIIVPKTFFYKYLLIFKSIIDFLPLIIYRNRKSQIFSTAWISSSQIIRLINLIKPDIVHLHWINEGLLSLSDIKKIKYPIVWSLHDNWAFTGGCHVKGECERFMDSCGNCPILSSEFKYDLSWINFHRKRSVYKSIIDRTTVVCLSDWMLQNAKKSKLLANFHTCKIPNPINSEFFRPLNKAQCRELFSIPLDKKVILFGALNPTGDKNKGFYLLKESLKLIEDENSIFVIFGALEDSYLADLNFKYIKIEPLKDNLSLNVLYNTADVFLVPSLQENLSNSIMESLSCGVPVVAFDTGGNSDLIVHRENGFLARKFDINDFSKGIIEMLYSLEYKKFSINARNSVVDKFDYKVIARQYLALYKELL